MYGYFEFKPCFSCGKYHKVYKYTKDSVCVCDKCKNKFEEDKMENIRK